MQLFLSGARRGRDGQLWQRVCAAERSGVRLGEELGPGCGRPSMPGKAYEFVLHLAGAGEPVVCVQDHGDAL